VAPDELLLCPERSPAFAAAHAAHVCTCSKTSGYTGVLPYGEMGCPDERSIRIALSSGAWYRCSVL